MYRLEELRKLSEAESSIKDGVIARLQKELQVVKQQLKELATIIRIPRKHHAYIREHGVAEFVEKCKEVVEHHDKVEEEREYSLERLRARKRESIEKYEENQEVG